MKNYRVDLHIHTVLSPCASLDMSPDNIVKKAKLEELDIIGITDHNSTKQCLVVEEIAKQYGITVLLGVEVTTKEEVHCLAYFKGREELNSFQAYLDEYLPVVINDVSKFGDQVWVNKNNEILGVEKRLLIVGINQSVEEVALMVHNLGGIFIPAHINKRSYSLISQLGFLPVGLEVSALEVIGERSLSEINNKHSWTNKYMLLRNSDAHSLHQIGTVYNNMELAAPTFSALKDALKTHRV